MRNVDASSVDASCNISFNNTTFNGMYLPVFTSVREEGKEPLLE